MLILLLCRICVARWSSSREHPQGLAEPLLTAWQPLAQQSLAHPAGPGGTQRPRTGSSSRWIRPAMTLSSSSSAGWLPRPSLCQEATHELPCYQMLQWVCVSACLRCWPVCSAVIIVCLGDVACKIVACAQCTVASLRQLAALKEAACVLQGGSLVWTHRCIVPERGAPVLWCATLTP